MPSGSAQPALQGRYRLEELVGHGAIASVYRATDVRGRRVVAVKRYDPHVQRDVGFVARFRRAARQARALDHAHILPTLSYGYAGETYFMVSEYIGGGSLARPRLARDERAWPELARIMAQVCAGLTYLHRLGLVHGNVKPSNILLREDGTALLADLGASHHLHSSDVTIAGAVLGAVAYYSPEHVTGAALSPASDIYGLGVVLYEACTGRWPFAAATPLALAHQHVHDAPPAPRSVYPHMSAALEAVMLRCLAKDPAHRYASASALAEAIMACTPDEELASREVAAPPLSVATVLRQQVSTHLDNLKQRLRQ